MDTKLAPARFETKVSDDGKKGEVTAFVSVYGNVDSDGDIVDPGFFTGHVDELKATGDPLPWVFAHNSRDINAYVGMVDPKTIDPAATFTDNTGAEQMGLKMTAIHDLDDPSSAKAFRLLDNRVVKQFSFAYDVTRAEQADAKSRKTPEHRRTLLEGKIFEAGPCLRGANSLTTLVGTKDATAKDSGKQYDMAGEVVGCWIGGFYIDQDPDGDYSDAAAAACALGLAGQLYQLAELVASSPATDPDHDADVAQAGALRQAADLVASTASDIVSTDQSEAGSGEADAGAASASLDGKGDRRTAAQKAADELREDAFREFDLSLVTVED